MRKKLPNKKMEYDRTDTFNAANYDKDIQIEVLLQSNFEEAREMEDDERKDLLTTLNKSSSEIATLAMNLQEKKDLANVQIKNSDDDETQAYLIEDDGDRTNSDGNRAISPFEDGRDIDETNSKRKLDPNCNGKLEKRALRNISKSNVENEDQSSPRPIESRSSKLRTSVESRRQNISVENRPNTLGERSKSSISRESRRPNISEESTKPNTLVESVGQNISGETSKSTTPVESRRSKRIGAVEDLKSNKKLLNRLSRLKDEEHEDVELVEQKKEQFDEDKSEDEQVHRSIRPSADRQRKLLLQTKCRIPLFRCTESIVLRNKYLHVMKLMLELQAKQIKKTKSKPEFDIYSVSAGAHFPDSLIKLTNAVKTVLRKRKEYEETYSEAISVSLPEAYDSVLNQVNESGDLNQNLKSQELTKTNSDFNESEKQTFISARQLKRKCKETKQYFTQNVFDIPKEIKDRNSEKIVFSFFEEDTDDEFMERKQRNLFDIKENKSLRNKDLDQAIQEISHFSENSNESQDSDWVPQSIEKISTLQSKSLKINKASKAKSTPAKRPRKLKESFKETKCDDLLSDFSKNRPSPPEKLSKTLIPQENELDELNLEESDIFGVDTLVVKKTEKQYTRKRNKQKNLKNTVLPRIEIENSSSSSSVFSSSGVTLNSQDDLFPCSKSRSTSPIYNLPIRLKDEQDSERTNNNTKSKPFLQSIPDIISLDSQETKESTIFTLNQPTLEFEKNKFSTFELSSEDEANLLQKSSRKKKKMSASKEKKKYLAKHIEHNEQKSTKRKSVAIADNSGDILDNFTDNSKKRKIEINITAEENLTDNDENVVGECPICLKKFTDESILERHAADCQDFPDLDFGRVTRGSTKRLKPESPMNETASRAGVLAGRHQI